MDIKQVQGVLDVVDKRNNKEYEWFKNVIISASTLLGILITLHSKKSEDIYIHTYFSLTIGLLGLGILSGTIYLYADTSTQHRLGKNLAENIRQSLNDTQTRSTLISAKPYKIFSYMRRISFVSLFLSIGFLVVYAILLDR